MDKEINKRINQLTKASPYFKKFSQKRYSKVKGYIDHDRVILDLARSLVSYDYCTTDYFAENITHSTSLIVLQKLYHDDFNSYWLTPELCHAFTKTKLPDNLDHIQQIIPAGVLMLPPLLKNADGQSVKWVAFYQRRAEERISTIQLATAKIDIAHDHHKTLTWVTILDDGSQYSGNVRVSEYNTRGANEFFYNHDNHENSSS